MATKLIYFAVLQLVAILQLSNALTCYNCYKDVSAKSLFFQPRSNINIPCTENINDWNTYECPGTNPVCVKIHYNAGGSGVITRTCSTAAADSCNNSLPGMDIVSCDACTTDLCNGESGDDPGFPENNSTCPLFTFDINLNVNLNVRNIQ